MQTCNLDYETRSECDLKLAGTYVYARHPSTRVLCAAFSIDGGPVEYWPAAAGHSAPSRLVEAMRRPGVEMHAWNAQFERLITKHVLGIDIPLSRWRCTAALARARGLPGKLEDALDFLGAAQSLAAKRRGGVIMRKWCQPLKTGGWADDPQEFMELMDYCIEDVKSEQYVGSRLVPLRPHELADYQLSERVNDVGLPVDRELALSALSYGAQEKLELNDELARITGNVITSTSQHARIKKWLKERLEPAVFKRHFLKVSTRKDDDGNAAKVWKESTDKASRGDFLLSEDAKEADPEVIEAIELIDDAGKASVAKYARIAARSVDNGRAEGAYIWAGAIQTKRYSSVGIQVHNFPRKCPSDIEAAVLEVLEHSVEGKVMHVLASLLRPTIQAPEGRVLVWGDWQAVEARGMPWLADAQAKLDLYRRNLDVYKVNAEDIFGTPYADVPDDERQIGKVAELSLQFGGAKGALKAMARAYGISLTEAKAGTVVAMWREANQWASTFSNQLYQAFMRAVMGTETTVGVVTYRQIDPLIVGTVSVACDLPDGTTLYYHNIKGTIVTRGLHGRRKTHKVFDGMDEWDGNDVHSWDTEVTFTKCMPGGFRTDRVWHGLLAENVTQAICAALLRDCMARTERALKAGKIDAFIVGHTHDEVILDSSIKHARRASNTLRREMVRVPKWLSGFPLGCELKSGPRYTK